MKTKNILTALMFAVVTLFVVSCEEVVVREPSPDVNPESNKVFFPNQPTKQVVVAIDQKTVTIPIERGVFDKELTVNLKFSGYKTISIPSSVKFDAGDKDTVVTITVGEIELMKNYLVTIEVDQAHTNPYDTLYNKTNFSILSLNLLREDFAPYAIGTYASEFFEDSREATLEYSPATKLYRFTDCWMPGYSVLFSWNTDATDADNKNKVEIKGTLNADKSFVYIPTGYVHSTYGMVNAWYSRANLKYYNEETKTFTFPITWRVSAGSFGAYDDTYKIETVL
ncbi:MAG: hypothetical protein EOM47_02655 [Bacteroidia bacterium]|nr:hypothetical protein [Bacteroidia bacterium]